MLIDRLDEYSSSGAYPFHMPGHKRQEIDPRLPYRLDITEIGGFDNLHAPSGCLREIERKAEKLYGADRAFLLINGATAGILAAVRAVTLPGDNVLIARNCHRSVYNAAELCSLSTGYVLPEIIDGKIYGAVSADSVERALERGGNVRAVVITSPTYEGICSDVGKIASVCRRYSAVLIVDEAHGAHLPFHSAFPESALSQGADIAVTSLHKTLPAPTQTALLLSNLRSAETQLQNNLAVFQTSSPSYPLMCGIELCLDYIVNNPGAFEEYVSNLKGFYNSVSDLSRFRVIQPDDWAGTERDIGKLLIFTDPSFLTGFSLAGLLRQYKIEIEMASVCYVIAMTSVTDTAEGFKRLSGALHGLELLCKGEQAGAVLRPALMESLPRAVYSAAEIRLMNPEKTVLPIEKAVGRVSLDCILAYPPGIPLIVPGEEISRETAEIICSLKQSKAELLSSEKNPPGTVTVAEL